MDTNIECDACGNNMFYLLRANGHIYAECEACGASALDICDSECH